jgi:hypothetical protein
MSSSGMVVQGKQIRVWEEESQPFYTGAFGDKVLEWSDYSPIRGSRARNRCAKLGNLSLQSASLPIIINSYAGTSIISEIGSPSFDANVNTT